MNGPKETQRSHYNKEQAHKKTKSEFMTNLNSFIDYFENNKDLRDHHSNKKEENFSAGLKEKYQMILKQLKVSNEEVKELRSQVEKLKLKKNDLTRTNNLLVREVNNHLVREQDLNKVNFLGVFFTILF